MQPTNLGHRMTPPSINPNAVFGPPRYTTAQQAANPDQPMTRVVKDVLSVGRWNTGGPKEARYQDFTLDTLNALARSVAMAQDAGHAINLTMSHGDEGLLVSTDELITPIDSVRVVGDWLWMACYVTPEDAAFLQNPAIKVSPGIMWDYLDGTGNKYPITMVHVAATDRPVVAGQGAFLAMANTASPVGREEMAIRRAFAPLLRMCDELAVQIDGIRARRMANVVHPTKPLSVRERANVELMGLGLGPVPSHVSESAIPAFLNGVRRATSPRKR